MNWQIIFSVVVFFLLVRPPLPALGEVAKARYALVIGNGAYEDSPLNNPANDARDMAHALAELGFEVERLENATRRSMEGAIREFGRLLRNGGVGLFFFAGHGVQVKEANYLIPVGARIYTEADVKYEAVDASRVLDEMNEAGNNLNIVILDACRDNPYAHHFITRRQGLARMDAPAGTLLAFATAPGATAMDGNDKNGAFTQFLLKHMTTPGLKIEEVMKLVRRDVIEATNSRQVPWQSSLLTEDFYFRPVVKKSDEPPKLSSRNIETDAITQIGPEMTPQVNFEDLQAEAELRKGWQTWQNAMEESWDRATAIERDAVLPNKKKAEIWKRILDAYAENNPFTRRDDELREKAEERIIFWNQKADN